MKRPLLLLSPFLLGITGLVGVPSAAHAAPTTCNGKPVTIVATFGTTTGTEGDDVVAMEPGQWTDFDALGGNDTICFDLGQAAGSFPANARLDAGPGDDTVISLIPPTTVGAQTSVGLGLGNDTFIGANAGEVVYADTDSGYDFLRPNSGLVGAQKDVISGATEVVSFAPEDGPNQDEVTFTGGEATAYVVGPMAPDSVLDFTAATESHLGVNSGGQADITVNAQTGTITSRNGTVLTWRGAVQSFGFGTSEPMPGEPVRPSVSFVGTDNAESLGFANTPIGDLDLGGGDDEVSVFSRIGTFIPRSVDGGDGHDALSIDATCKELIVRLDSRSRCDSTNGTVSSFEEVSAAANPTRDRSVMVVGTEKPEVIYASSAEVLVEAGAGNDEIVAEGLSRSVVKGGAGADRIRVNGRYVLARGDRGADNIRLGDDMRSSRPKVPVRTLLGGPGDDKMFGSKLKIGDRLIGGPGRDMADGRAGSRDYCIAEVRRNCERP